MSNILSYVHAQAMKTGAAWGQEQFQLLLQESQSSETGSEAADMCFEDLRYRWMLHKSKLKDIGELRASANTKVRGDTWHWGSTAVPIVNVFLT